MHFYIHGKFLKIGGDYARTPSESRWRSVSKVFFLNYFLTFPFINKQSFIYHSLGFCKYVSIKFNSHLQRLWFFSEMQKSNVCLAKCKSNVCWKKKSVTIISRVSKVFFLNYFLTFPFINKQSFIYHSLGFCKYFSILINSHL